MSRRYQKYVQAELNEPTVNAFDPKVWRITSNKYRSISRVPGCKIDEREKVEAKIRELDPEMYERFHKMSFHAFVGQFLRCSKEAEHIDLSIGEFAAFKKNGGEGA